MTGGIFSEWQPRYAEHDIATFPVTPNKVPGVKGYLKVGRDYSEQLSIKFADANAFGFACKRNRITVLDVDTPDERVLADALARHGQTPIIVRSGSGNFQGWYRSSGENRRVRPDPSLPIDILGDGFVVAPPSKASKGQYQIVQGTLDDIGRLPRMHNAVRRSSLSENPTLTDTAGKMSENVDISAAPEPAPIDQKRNDSLFRHCMRAARTCGSLEKLMEAAIEYNNGEFYRPLPPEEVLRIVASAWGYESEGKNRFSAGPRVVLEVDVVDALAADDPRAFALFSILCRHHHGADSFYLAKAMAKSMGWDLRAFKSARDALVDRGLIVCVHAGGKGPNDPPVYRLPITPIRGTNLHPNTNKHPLSSSFLLSSLTREGDER